MKKVFFVTSLIFCTSLLSNNEHEAPRSSLVQRAVQFASNFLPVNQTLEQCTQESARLRDNFSKLKFILTMLVITNRTLRDSNIKLIAEQAQDAILLDNTAKETATTIRKLNDDIATRDTSLSVITQENQQLKEQIASLKNYIKIGGAVVVGSAAIFATYKLYQYIKNRKPRAIKS